MVISDWLCFDFPRRYSERVYSSLSVPICYGCLSLFISLLNNVFILYYVDIFVNVYKIDQYSFWIGELVFLLWNSINDPLFGWLSDRQYLQAQQSDSPHDDHSSKVVLKRIRSLKTCGPFFAISFLLFWFQLGYPGIQFVFGLCLYDSFLTMVDLHHQALLADLAIKAEDRTKLNSFCSLFSAFGSASVFLSFFVWNRENIYAFQIFCLSLSILCICGFQICCSALEWHFTDLLPTLSSSQFTTQSHGIKIEPGAKKPITAIEYGKQVLKHKNFMWFALMNLLQVFHCHFNSNFFPLFLTHLLGHIITPATGALILGFSFLVPHLNNLYFLSLCSKYGAYSVIKLLFAIKLLLGVAMIALGQDWWIVLCVYIACNRVFTEGTCKLLNLVISDLVDEDYVKNHRTEAVSALVFGMSALLSKPGQTLAPLLGTWFLYLQTGRSVFFNKQSELIVDGSTTSTDLAFRSGCFVVLIYVPIGCATLQLFAWSKFTLNGWRLNQIKTARSGHENKTKFM